MQMQIFDIYFTQNDKMDLCEIRHKSFSQK